MAMSRMCKEAAIAYQYLITNNYKELTAEPPE
jgi:hypothetical protein